MRGQAYSLTWGMARLVLLKVRPRSKHGQSVLPPLRSFPAKRFVNAAAPEFGSRNADIGPCQSPLARPLGRPPVSHVLSLTGGHFLVGASTNLDEPHALWHAPCRCYRTGRACRNNPLPLATSEQFAFDCLNLATGMLTLGQCQNTLWHMTTGSPAG